MLGLLQGSLRELQMAPACLVVGFAFVFSLLKLSVVRIMLLSKLVLGSSHVQGSPTRLFIVHTYVHTFSGFLKNHDLSVHDTLQHGMYGNQQRVEQHRRKPTHGKRDMFSSEHEYWANPQKCATFLFAAGMFVLAS